jgi:RimJ/RimL family protein N-acetyltransferase
MTGILETDRLLLREFVMDDLEDFFRMVSDPEVTRFTGGSVQTLEEAKKMLQERPMQDYRKYGYGRWAAVYKASGQVIGFAGLKYLDDIGEVDLGYRFFKEYWGKGLATEAARALLAHGFGALGLKRILAFADSDNKASIRVLEKVGFKFDKLARYRDWDVAWYILSRTQEATS